MDDKKRKLGVYSGTTIRDAQIPKGVVLTGWKFYGFVGMFVGTIALMLYPIVVHPILHIDEYKEAHKQMQTELMQAGLLPGQLKKWEDPFKFDPKEDK